MSASPYSTLVIFQLLAPVAIFGWIALMVFIDQRGRTKRRELEKIERMRALELGQLPDDAAVARAHAAGAIGVVSVLGSLVAALIATPLLLYFPPRGEPQWVLAIVVWSITGTIALVGTCGIFGLIAGRSGGCHPKEENDHGQHDQRENDQRESDQGETDPHRV